MAGDRNLSHVPFLAELEDTELQALAAACHLRRFRRGEVLFHEGDLGNALFLIQSGQVKIVRITDKGEDQRLHVLGPGEYLGELSLLDGAPCSATAQALDSVETLTLHRDDFIALIGRHPRVVLAVMSGLIGMLRRLSAPVRNAGELDIRGRIAKTLWDLALRYGETTPEGLRITRRLTLVELEQMVGLRHISINRHLGWFRQRGILTADREGIITIHKPEERSSAPNSRLGE